LRSVALGALGWSATAAIAWAQAAPAPAAAPVAASAPNTGNTGDADLSDPDFTPKRTGTGGYTLRRCLELSAVNFPKVQEARAKAAKARAQLSEARFAPFNEFTMTGGLGLAPSVRGTPVYSPDSDLSLSSTMGVAWQVGFDGVIPLWTFGKLSNLADAAEAQTKVGAQEIQKAKNELQLQVRQAFYGLQLATDALDLLHGAVQRMDKHLARMEAKTEPGAEDIELLKLKMNRAELAARESEVVKQSEIARAGLAFLIGAKQRVEIVDQPLKRLDHPLAPLARYLMAARLYRPEINMARAGVLAREAQLRIQQARYYPDLGLGLSAGWSQAREIDDQQNPFVRDPVNYLRYAAGLVMRWKLDFLSNSAREAQAEADLEAMRASEQYALGGVGVEVQTAFHEARDAEKRLDAYTDATRYARRWLVMVQQGIDIGTFDDEDIIEPAREYALKRYARMQATFDYNVALAKLALATGWQTVTPDQ
jgi:outer membrane protein TolC